MFNTIHFSSKPNILLNSYVCNFVSVCFTIGKLCRIPHGASNVEIEVTSSPAKWPGVKFFLSILSANKKDERNVLNLLLCEAAVAVYLSFFVSACSVSTFYFLRSCVSSPMTIKFFKKHNDDQKSP